MSMFFNDIVRVIDQGGTTRGQLRAVVDKNSITTQDASLPIEVGDTIERDLPHGRKETLSVTHVQFYRGSGGIRDFYEITIQPNLRPATGDLEMEISHIQPATDTRKVFVIHGRNELARKAVFAQLRTFDLEPMEWSEARRGTGQSTPNIQSILDYAFNAAQACVVLLTPDEEVQLRPEYGTDKDKQVELELGGQARPNVLWEGGMAYGRDPGKTVILEIGSLRPFTDISGLHTIRMDSSPARIKVFGESLESSGCSVKWDGTDWMDTVDWKSVIAALHENNRFDTAERNEAEEEHTLCLSAEVRPSTTGSLLGMGDAVDADVTIVNHGMERINIKEVGLQVDGEDIPFRFKANGTGDNIPDHLPARDSAKFSRIFASQKIRDHYELNVYVVDGTRRRTFAKVIVDPSFTQ